ncbi:methanethiol S-methyltransferase [Salinarimonas sp.]|uniref:methanethiol S-methyltransferase n=1 Tax=Salinarimonas sp. TaxID=2766526 RepID=UPI00391B31CB
MRKTVATLAALAYGVGAYVLFLGVFLYAIAFVGNLPVPKTIDSGAPGPLVGSLAVNLALLGLFALQHSVMARGGFKRLWTRVVPPVIERSTYVLLASLALALLFWQWRPLPQPVWAVEDPLAAAMLVGLFWSGWAIVLASTFLINHFELFGLRQVHAHAVGAVLPKPELRTPLFYKRVRHPIYLGFLVAFWATPTMSLGHLVFAIATTAYILLGIRLEERDLVRQFGEAYRRYRREVRMLIPLRRRTDAHDRPRADGAL